jgi:phenylacetate-CoA ligase
MNKHFLKNLRDNLPEPIKYLISPIFRNKLIQNKSFKEFYSLLEQSEKFNENFVMEYKLKRLKDILNYAYNNVPYYNELFKKVGFDYNKFNNFEDINLIPFLTKDIIRNNFDKLTSRAKVSGGYYIATTGGTTGEPLKILLDYESIFKENAFIYHFRKNLGYQFDDKIATFRGVEFGNKLWKFNPMYNEMLFSPFKLSKSTLNKYVKKIDSFNPKYLNGYLSSMYFFAKLMDDNKLHLSSRLKGIFLIGENIEAEQRQFIEKFFGIKSSTFYGHTERCVIAEEIRETLFKFNPFYGYTELLKNSNDSYDIVSTGFLNKIMPLIRYKTGDLCIKENNLIKVQGRWNVSDFLIGLHDEKISHASINFHSEILRNVANYQFIQNKKGKVELLLTVNSSFKSSEINLIKKEIDKKTKDIIDFDIKIVDSFQLSSRGKFKRFISNMPNE